MGMPKLLRNIPYFHTPGGDTPICNDERESPVTKSRLQCERAERKVCCLEQTDEIKGDDRSSQEKGLERADPWQSALQQNRRLTPTLPIPKQRRHLGLRIAMHILHLLKGAPPLATHQHLIQSHQSLLRTSSRGLHVWGNARRIPRPRNQRLDVPINWENLLKNQENTVCHWLWAWVGTDFFDKPPQVEERMRKNVREDIVADNLVAPQCRDYVYELTGLHGSLMKRDIIG